MQATDLINGKTHLEWLEEAVRYEAMANQASERSAESFARSDTDGFMSQWANDSQSRLYRAQAQWARSHGMVTTTVLLDTEGNVASTHLFEGQWGLGWVLRPDAEKKYGRKFFNPSQAQSPERRRLANRKRGFVIALVRVPGYVKNHGAGQGLSGALTVRPCEFPDIDALKEDRFEIVEPDIYAKGD